MLTSLPIDVLKRMPNLKKIRSAQVQAMVTVNHQLLTLYWEIGCPDEQKRFWQVAATRYDSQIKRVNKIKV